MTPAHQLQLDTRAIELAEAALRAVEAHETLCKLRHSTLLDALEEGRRERAGLRHELREGLASIHRLMWSAALGAIATLSCWIAWLVAHGVLRLD